MLRPGQEPSGRRTLCRTLAQHEGGLRGAAGSGQKEKGLHWESTAFHERLCRGPHVFLRVSGAGADRGPVGPLQRDASPRSSARAKPTSLQRHGTGGRAQSGGLGVRRG